MAAKLQRHNQDQPLSQKAQQFKEAFYDEMTQFIKKVEALETTVERMQSSKTIPRVVPFAGNDLADVEKKEKHVHDFFFKRNYTEVISHTPKNVEKEQYQELLINLSKLHYDAAKRIWQKEASNLLSELHRHQSNLDDDVLEQLSMVHGILGSLILPRKRSKMCEEIRKEMGHKFGKPENAALYQLYEQCRTKSNNNWEEFTQFNKHLVDVSLDMVSVSPPMILHAGGTHDTLNPMWLEYRSKPPLRWVRPVILKNYVGMPLVKGIAEGPEDSNRQEFLHEISNVM